MTAPLFFADAEKLRAASVGDVVSLDGPEGHHAAVVRRLTVGETLDLSDGFGLLCRAEVTTVGQRGLSAIVLARDVVASPVPRLVVVQALAKGDRDERAVEMMTEVGVDEIVPWQASRSIVRWDADRAEKGVARWRSIAWEAAKQSRRPWLVEVAPVASTAMVVDRIRAVSGRAMVLHEAAALPLNGLEFTSCEEILLVVGPEGGITDDEMAAFTAAGASTCRLGQTVMRTSTAGTAATAAVMVLSGRWA